MIVEFKNNCGWLSNFAPVKITLNGREYPSVEHAYMSAKSEDQEWKDFCASNVSAGTVKRKSKELKLNKNWGQHKLLVMNKCLEQKFNQEPFKTLLLNTGDEQIVEGNWWGDEFWGVNLQTGEGQNMLGKMIMDIRDKISEKKFIYVVEEFGGRWEDKWAYQIFATKDKQMAERYSERFNRILEDNSERIRNWNPEQGVVDIDKLTDEEYNRLFSKYPFWYSKITSWDSAGTRVVEIELR